MTTNSNQGGVSIHAEHVNGSVVQQPESDDVSNLNQTRSDTRLLNVTNRPPIPATPSTRSIPLEEHSTSHSVNGSDHEINNRKLSDSGEILTDVRVIRAIRKLSRAYQYSVDCDRSKWDFAVEIADMDTLDVSHDELRWLIGKGLVEHAREIRLADGIGRSFDSPGGFTFGESSCFVITSTGLKLATELAAEPADDFLRLDVAESGRPGDNGPRPYWDDQRHELWIGNVLVKRFKWRASNQEAILAAFQEDGWPPRIDDPLAPVPETDPKRRLSDTIKCLNRKQQNSLVRFCGDGTGEGVLWGVNVPGSESR